MVRIAWAGLGLGLAVAMAPPAIAQERAPPGGIELKQNYPNPFNPATTIPFSIGEALFRDGHRPAVSLRIFNVLAQLVAVPILQGTGEPLEQQRLTWNGTGVYSAYWDGKVLNSDREAPSGIYIYQLVVDGQRITRKMIVRK